MSVVTIAWRNLVKSPWKMFGVMLTAGLLMSIYSVLSAHGAAHAADAAAAAPADSGGEATAAGYRPMTFMLFQEYMGPCGWVQQIISIWMVAITIQYYIEFRRDKICPDYLRDELQGLVEEGNYEEALALCEQEDCYMTRVIGSGLARLDNGTDSMMKAMADTGEAEAAVYFQKNSWLAFITGVEPMLGLLGTVQGMISAFDQIAKTGNATPAQLASGISQALLTTAVGLIVAVPASTFFAIFKNRLVKFVLDVNMIGTDLVESVKAQKAAEGK
ncbi:MAG: MotA/TolQ/ExbB proton channel family protein [Planctomycetota bacterium]